jgi:hypothetical protein
MTALPAPINPALIRDVAAIIGPHRAMLSFLSIEQAGVLLDTLGKIQFGPSGITIKYHHPYSYLIPHPAVLEWTKENPHLRKRDRTQPTFKTPPERAEAEARRKAKQRAGLRSEREKPPSPPGKVVAETGA